MDEKIGRQQAHFDSIAERYEKARQHRNHLCLKELIWSEILGDKLLDLPDPVSVLEPMCGFGDGLQILASRLSQTVEYSGFDFSGEVISRLKRRQPAIDVWEADVSTFESDRSYDIIILLGGLHHVPHIAAKVVSRLSAYVAKGGFFINFEPTHGNALFRSIRERIYNRNALFDEQTERAFAVDELLGFFQAGGLEPVDVIYPGLLSYILYYNPDAFPYLNIGSPRLVRAIWALERKLVRSRFGRKVSFATLSMWRKPV